MIILIPDLDERIDPETLHAFVISCMKKIWLLPVFRRKGRLQRCEILQIRERDGDRVQYQGLAHVDDDLTGEALIKQLKACRLEGKELHPRIYHSRSAGKERRVNLVDSSDIAIVDRRRRDRRRNNLSIERFVFSAGPSAPPV